MLLMLLLPLQRRIKMPPLLSQPRLMQLMTKKLKQQQTKLLPMLPPPPQRPIKMLLLLPLPRLRLTKMQPLLLKQKQKES
jgi:hypothetical protein